jgi:hypothetical protein
MATAVLTAATAAMATPPSALDPNPYSVMRPESVAPFFAAARERRVDMAIIGDSNTRALNTSGLEDTMGRGFMSHFGCYATRVDPVAGIGAWGAMILGSNSVQHTALTTGAPEHLLLTSLPDDAGFPGGYAHLGHDQELGTGNNSGLTLSAAHPIDITGPLRWHMTFYSFPALADSTLGRNGEPGQAQPVPTGRFAPTARAAWPGNAWVNYASDLVDTTVPGVIGFHDWSLDLPAGERSPSGVLFCLTSTAEQVPARGPFYARWHRAENTARSTGLAYSPLLYQGGRTTRDAAVSLVTRATQSQMSEWLRHVTRLQNGEPMLLVQIIQGANDANTEDPALIYNRGDAPRPADQWPHGAPTNEREGIKQNFMSVINRMRDFWEGAGYNPDNLYFLIGNYFPHPPSWNGGGDEDPDGPQYRVIREEAIPAWREICLENRNIAMVDGYKLSSPEEFLANGWYRFTSTFYNDHAHLSLSGYSAWGNAVAEAVTRACDCGPSVDIDLNGRREVADIFAFLSLWFAADPRANFDQVGAAPAVPDIFAFLSSWFAGCAGH